MVDALEVTESLDKFCFAQIGDRGHDTASSAGCGVCSRPFVTSPVYGGRLRREDRCGPASELVLVHLVMFDDGKLWGRRVHRLEPSICG
jgi:hypothetical protein